MLELGDVRESSSTSRKVFTELEVTINKEALASRPPIMEVLLLG